MKRQMNYPRNWIIVAFILSGIVGVSAMWLADRRMKQQAAENSMTGIRAALTPFERDRARAVKKAKQAGIDPRWVEGR